MRKRTVQNGPTTDINIKFYWNDSNMGENHIYEVVNANHIPQVGQWINTKIDQTPSDPIREVVMVTIEYKPSGTFVVCHVN